MAKCPQNDSYCRIDKFCLCSNSRSNIQVKVQCTLDIQHCGKNVLLLFIVADTNSPPIIGLNSSKQLNLIKRILSVTLKSHQNWYAKNQLINVTKIWWKNIKFRGTIDIDKNVLKKGFYFLVSLPWLKYLDQWAIHYVDMKRTRLKFYLIMQRSII